MMIVVTKKEAIDLAIEQWELMHTTGITKYKASLAVKLKHAHDALPQALCFLCEYAANSTNESINDLCESCPIDWGVQASDDKYETPCNKLHNYWVQDSNPLPMLNMLKIHRIPSVVK